MFSKEVTKWSLIHFYSKLDPTFDTKLKEGIKEIVIRAILAMARGIVGVGIRPYQRVRIPFKAGLDEIDLETTLDNYYKKQKHLNYQDIIAIDKKPKRIAVTLMLDVSNSMNFEKISIAAIAIATLAYKLRDDYYSIISFSEKADIVKPMSEKYEIEKLVDKILNLQTGGLTNISGALETGLKELNSSESRNAHRRIGILVTDGWVTEGADPRETAKKFEKLHVIEIPPGGIDDKLCYQIAKLGKGRYVRIRDFYELTRIARIIT